MADHSGTFLLITILTLLTIIIISGMKYFSAGRAARLQAEIRGDHNGLTGDVAEIKSRLATIERILREVE